MFRGFTNAYIKTRTAVRFVEQTCTLTAVRMIYVVYALREFAGVNTYIFFGLCFLRMQQLKV